MKKSLLPALIILLITAVGGVFAVTSFHETTLLYKFVNGITVSGGTADFTGATISGLSLGAGSLAADSVGSSEIAANAVGTSEIATSGVATAEIADSTITGADMAAASLRLSFCGELAENGATYLGPAGITVQDPLLAGTVCDALDNTTEASADVVVSAGLTLYAKYMRCITDGTLGASETLVYQLRDDAASVTGVTCTISEAETECEVLVPSATAIAAGSAIAVAATETSNNADDNGKCIVLFDVN